MKQMSRILQEVNYNLHNIKLVKCLAVHNEEDWVEYNLANNYDEYDIIRVVEGAVSGRPKSTPDGHSTDKTLELIRNFPDPDGKIQLYTLNRPFKSLEEQKQVFLETATEGEWLFIVDCDEFYMDGDINRVREAINLHPTASEFIPTFLHFYRDFYHLKAPHPEWQMQHQRILRYRNGLRYHTHPVATDAAGKCTYFTPEYQINRYTLPIYIYHYGHAKGKEFHRMKHDFYKKELEKFKLADGTSAADKFDEKFVEFMEYKEDLDTILHYVGPHPEVFSGSHLLNFADEHYIVAHLAENMTSPKHWKDDPIYSRDKLPTIALWMLDPWKRMQELYNVCEV